jgi:hypothetical protein
MKDFQNRRQRFNSQFKKALIKVAEILTLAFCGIWSVNGIEEGEKPLITRRLNEISMF